jgi:hypothetical protein
MIDFLIIKSTISLCVLLHVPFGVGKEKIHPSIGSTSYPVIIFIYDSVYHHRNSSENHRSAAKTRLH